MTEGHPGFVANNGRIGFGVSDHAAYAPESGRPFRLVWLAARRSLSHLALGAGLDEDASFLDELSPAERARFDARLEEIGEDPADYLLLRCTRGSGSTGSRSRSLPTSPAGISSSRRERRRVPRPAVVRTCSTPTDPDRHYVKTALAVQNMGFLRGLSPAYMRVTPAINDWVADLVAGDATLRESGFRVLRERASIGYTGDAYHRTPTPSAHRKMLAALWRESPVPLSPRRAPRHHGVAAAPRRAGRSFATALVRASGIPPASGCGRTCAPTCARSCTACSPTTSRSCRTARTSS